MHVLLYTVALPTGARSTTLFRHWQLSVFSFGCVRCIVWLPLPDMSGAVLFANTWLGGLGTSSKRR